jgi:SAM-dependent methyltransferase
MRKKKNNVANGSAKTKVESSVFEAHGQCAMNELPGSDYPLGSSDAEHERLIRQARHMAPFTERFFREAGIGPGQRVLDLGSGVGDVAMLVGKPVLPSGEVVGIERDERSLALARARAREARHLNVRFIRSDVTEISSDQLFDAVVGRFILQFLPDPVNVWDQPFNCLTLEESLLSKNPPSPLSFTCVRTCRFGLLGPR